MSEIMTTTSGAESSAPKRKSELNAKYKNYIFVFFCLLYPVGLWAFFFFTTNVQSIILAFEKIDYAGNVTFNGFKNFQEFINMLFEDSGFLGISFINTLKNYIIPLVICVPLYLIFSYYIFKKAKGSKFVQFIAMIPSIIPGMVISLVFKLFVETTLPRVCGAVFGISDFPNLFSDPKYTYGTTLFYTIWLSFSTSLIVYPNAMNSIQQEIFESSEIDGDDNFFSEMWYIILPLIYPTLSTFLITGFAAFLMNSGSLVTFWLGGAPLETYNLGYYYYVKTFVEANEMDYPMLSAGGLIMTAVVAPLTLLLKWVLEKFGPSED